MKTFIIVLIGLAFTGFIVGLAGQARAVKKKCIKKNNFYKKVTAISLVLMFVFAAVYRFVL